MASKEKKGAKFGRHGRNPSSNLQAQRTAKNKRIALEKEVKRNPSATLPGSKAHPKRGFSPEKKRNPPNPPLVPDQSGIPLHMLYVDSTLVEISPRVSAIAAAKAESHSKLSFSHRVLNPVSGLQTILDSRKAN